MSWLEPVPSGTALLRLAVRATSLAVLGAVVALLLAQTVGAIQLPLIGHYGVAPGAGPGPTR